MKLFFYSFILLLVSNLYGYKDDANLDSLYRVLEETMDKREVYEDHKESKINAFKSLLNSDLSLENRYEINNKIISEYDFYSFDSTLSYLESNLSIGQKLNNVNFILETRIKIVRRLINSGREIEGFNALKTIVRSKLPDNLIYDYYRICYDAYIQLAAQSSLESNQEFYSNLSQQYYDSLINILPVNSGRYEDLLEIEYFRKGEYEKSLELNTQRMAKINPNSEYFPLLNFYRANRYRKLNNLELAKKHFIITAILDIQRSRKNNAAMAELAIMLFRENKLDQANRYINFAMEDARFYNSKFRFLYLSEALPVINEAYQQSISKQKGNLRIYSVISSCLAILFFIAVVLIYIQIKKLSEARNELGKANSSLKDFNVRLNESNISLKESNHIKEQYIAHFLEICSKYIDKLDNYRKMVNKEIANRNVAELFETTKSKRIIEREQTEFYRNFDQTFLAIYPNFIEKINDLLIAEDQIDLKADELLNTELRILALTRLGITDSSKIARLLRYSVNTIYNYRAQLKNKAKGDRELFEQHILEIGAEF